jgi:chitinase
MQVNAVIYIDDPSNNWSGTALLGSSGGGISMNPDKGDRAVRGSGPAGSEGGPKEVFQDFGDDGEARQRLSPVRVLAALVIVGGSLTAGGLGIRNAITGHRQTTLQAGWFAPYVDTTLTPSYQFQDPDSSPARQVVLGFVVSSPTSACTPSWGGYYTLGQADGSINLDRRLAELRSEGGGAIISFGGQANTELAVDCTNQAALESAYESVISRYDASTVDFDIEGGAVADTASVQRRAKAIAAVQAWAAKRKSKLAVWLTLPVEPSGLDANTLSVVTETLRQHVSLSGVDVMAMDYGHPVGNMARAAEQALTSTHGQLSGILKSASSAQLWNQLGVTVMIGQNDSSGEQFTLGDARQLAGFVDSHHVARVSSWSINRDVQCGSAYPEVGVSSNSCSGVAQSSLEFDHVFSSLSGSASAVAGIPVASPSSNSPSSAPVSAANDPYPLWQPADSYVTGYKVVWQGDVYQAKWYNQGADPATAVQSAWETPWLLLGPVLPTDHAPTTTTLPQGTYPSWGPNSTYQAGAKVLFAGEPYQAKWYNQGDSPAAEASDSSASPWNPLFSIPGEPSATS